MPCSTQALLTGSFCAFLMSRRISFFLRSSRRYSHSKPTCRSRNEVVICPPYSLSSSKIHGKRSFIARHSTSRDFICPEYVSPPYSTVRIRCDRDDCDMLSDALLGFGASSVTIDEDNSESTDELSPQIDINAIFVDCEDVGSCISFAANSIGLKKTPKYEVTLDEECDWAKNMQGAFLPVKVSDGLWIVPEWESPPDCEATNIILNPGMAFGTGEHPTTKLCLLVLHRMIRGGERVLDYGTGSGILAIAALKLGASLAVGIDIDPQSITSAQQNAALNNISSEQMPLFLASSENPDKSTFQWRDNLISEKGTYDIIVANILLNPLLELVDQIISYAKPGGVIGVSGILSEQVEQIKECYSRYLDGIKISEMDGWACLNGYKKIK